MTKKITRRQKEFLGQFLDAYQEMGAPLHYVELAKRLDLGKVTVYEMLRLLEKRGLVQSEYQLAAGNRGPGRASVLFQPTPEGIRLLNTLAEGAAETASWEATKEQILTQLQNGKAEEYELILNELLVRIPENRSPSIYITEMITATILSVASIQQAAEDKGLLDLLNRVGLPGEIGLSALAGIGSALTMVEDVNLRFSSFLLEQSGAYNETLKQLSTEKRQQLSDFARQVVGIIKN